MIEFLKFILALLALGSIAIMLLALMDMFVNEFLGGR